MAAASAGLSVRETPPEGFGDSAYAEIAGDIDNDTAVALLDEGKAFLASANSRDVIIDFSRVKTAQSVALSLMVRWLDTAAKHDRSLRFKGLSGKLHDLAKVSGLEEVLPLA
ncbi:STAS domain-containing protein [Allohahella marinimesophila]|uniref:STAS domain-containing protein n=1 Tax=Allohahella marinimesophila TaxID=1054972 RepID=A0ABP7PY22_9GAMM